MKTIRAIHDAVSDPVRDLSTYRALPTMSLPKLDPFLLINHHGYQEYGPNNTGLPFGPHPHRGFETLTFIFEGEVVHKDSAGGSFTSGPGGAQWMTAGQGIIHSEVSSEKFHRDGGPMEVIQLWMNLPARLKSVAPWYKGFDPNEITTLEGEGTKWNLISGEASNAKGPVDSHMGLLMSSLEMKAGSTFKDVLPADRTLLFYVVRGEVSVNGAQAHKRQIVEFDSEAGTIEVEALDDAILLYCHGTPLKEPVAQYGPFVMNTQQEIEQAIRDYQEGKFQ